MKTVWMLVSALALLAPGTPRAEVRQVAVDGFAIHQEHVFSDAPEQIFAQLLKVDQWWSPAHTWSGSAANLSLDPHAGGCFCERWPGGEAEHLRVGFILPNQSLRLLGGLGPLQGMALWGSLEFKIAAVEGGQRLSLDYRVSGDSLHALATLAPVVDGVLAEQFGRLTRLIETGSPLPANAGDN